MPEQVQPPRAGGQGTDPPEGRASASTPALDFSDPAAVLAWIKYVETHAETLIDVAEDQIDAPSKRLYGRAGAREKIDEAAGALREQFAYARRGLPATSDTPAPEEKP